MTSYTVHDMTSVPEAARATLEKIEAAMGFVPDMLAVFAESPVVLGGSFALFGQLGAGSFSPVEQQVIAITISRENGCHYCVAAHSTFATGAKVDPVTLAALRAGRPLGDARLEALRTVTLALLAKRGWLSEADQAAFFAAGFNKAQMLEVIAWIGLKTITNYINHIAATPVDDAFKAAAAA